eukprot:PhF_6_TR18945/c0_g2_i2/m.27769
MKSIEQRLQHVAGSVDNVPIRRDGSKQPMAIFTHTDFVSTITPDLVEDMAACLVASGIPFDQCDVIVSVADRIAGALVHVISRLTKKPYTLANWYPVGSPGDIEIRASRGFALPAGGAGVIYLNGLTPGMKAVYIGDDIVGGSTAKNVIDGCRAAGADVIHAGFVVEIVGAGGRDKLKEYPMTSLIPLDLNAGDRTVIRHPIAAMVKPVPAEDPCLTLEQIKALPKETIANYKAIVEKTFVGIPIVVNPSLGYPYSFFQLTDFKPVMDAIIVEMMADLCCYYAENMKECDVIVSEADRGGGPLAHAIAQRLRMPYILAVWSTVADTSVSVGDTVQIGFSGQGRLFVNGLTKGMKVAFVDDMLSSGGTAEGVLKAVESTGGVPVYGVFISEKLYPPPDVRRKGLQRILGLWPTLKVSSVVKFVASGDSTQAAPLEEQ